MLFTECNLLTYSIFVLKLKDKYMKEKSYNDFSLTSNPFDALVLNSKEIAETYITKFVKHHKLLYSKEIKPQIYEIKIYDYDIINSSKELETYVLNEKDIDDTEEIQGNTDQAAVEVSRQ